VSVKQRSCDYDYGIRYSLKFKCGSLLGSWSDALKELPPSIQG